MKRWLCGWMLLLLPINLYAANFVDVFNDAVANDPKFKAAQAEYQAIAKDIPINVANFLPQISAAGYATRTRQDNRTNVPITENGVFYNNIVDYSLSLNQSIYNYANWTRLSTAHANVKQAAANLCAATQDLIIRTSEAYFRVLNASEDLRFTRAEKTAIKRELDQNTERYRVGLIAITAVYDAQASYDAVVAREIASINAFADRIEELREITGRSYPVLMGVDKNFPLVRPNPASIDQWVCQAGKHNYGLEAAHYASVAARENIKTQFSGHLPTVNAGASLEYNSQSNTPFAGPGYTKDKYASVSLTGALPIFSGGSVVALTEQARFYFLQTVAEEERVRRSVVSQTRKAYMGVISGISQVRADKQAIISRNNELDATRAAYEVGTRTMVDVLDSQSKLFDTQRIAVRSQYIYLAQTLLLKQQAGTLSSCDVAQLNRWFKQPAKMISYRDVGVTQVEPHHIPEQISDKALSSTPEPVASPDAPIKPVIPEPADAEEESEEQDEPEVPDVKPPAKPTKP